DTIAVDRHIYSYVEQAGIEYKNYEMIKNIVEFAADILNISRRSIDYSIWSHMSKNQGVQIAIDF
ncbi:hypothetical protein LJB95_03040, partial [Paludibacteraceae bacterium OttesenSCG-928-F17]|nr:hypothetical protein [Paludibacteraceae bacterium OttesenSCG-928-F17]